MCTRYVYISIYFFFIITVINIIIFATMHRDIAFDFVYIYEVFRAAAAASTFSIYTCMQFLRHRTCLRVYNIYLCKKHRRGRGERPTGLLQKRAGRCASPRLVSRSWWCPRALQISFASRACIRCLYIRDYIPLTISVYIYIYNKIIYYALQVSILPIILMLTS